MAKHKPGKSSVVPRRGSVMYSSMALLSLKVLNFSSRGALAKFLYILEVGLLYFVAVTL